MVWFEKSWLVPDQKKHIGLRIDIANAVPKLSKVMDKATATAGHMKELLRCIKYVLDTKDWKLWYQLSRQDKIEITGICKSDYAGDPESRRNALLPGDPDSRK